MEPANEAGGIHRRAFGFACDVVRLSQTIGDRPGTARTLAIQLLRSGTSIGASLEEARAGQSRRDFLAKCSIALKEARETHYWLRLMRACDLIPEQQAEALVSEADQIVAILTRIVKTTRATPDPRSR